MSFPSICSSRYRTAGRRNHNRRAADADGNRKICRPCRRGADRSDERAKRQEHYRQARRRLYGLYNTASGYLGDILSYSRLLALGLSTGVIATVINLLGTMPGNKVAKLILFIIVFLLGHTANIAINLIGTYVHTNRLQYVEFFSKFYEGGGRSFTPLKADTKHFRFKEEIQ